MAAGDTVSVTVLSNGREADIVIAGMGTGGTYDFGLGANNDPATGTPKVTFTVVSLGYDATGAATTITRTVYGTKQVRKPYPDQATNEESNDGTNTTVRVALSDYIYAKDATGAGNSGTAPVASILSGFYTKTGTPNNSSGEGFAVTNNSTVAYPKVIGHFATEQRRPVNGTEAIEVFAVQKFGTNGKPVAFVSVTATGATSGHAESGSATAMTLSARGDLIPVYAVSLNLSTGAGFTRGERVDVNFVAKPWLGDAASCLDSSADAGTQIYQLGPLRRTIMDKVIAVVDTATGNDTTGVASTSQAAADAAPCATWNGARTKIAEYNNATYSLNRLDGGEVQLKAGSYTYAKSSQASTNGYFTTTRHSSATRAQVILIQSSADYQYAFMRLLDITITRASNTFLLFAVNGNVLVMEGVNFDDARTAWYSGDTDTNLEFVDCVSNNGYFSRGGNDGHARLIRNQTYTATNGSDQFGAGSASCVLGYHSMGESSITWTANSTGTSSNFVFVYSTIMSKSDGLTWTEGTATDLSNWAILNNLVERTGAASTPLAEISDANISNLLIAHNTFAGQRFNHENDIVAPFVNKTFVDYVGKFNAFNARGDHRADILDTDASMVGTWSVGYSVGWESNHNEAISYSGDTDFWGLSSNFTAGQTSISPSVPAGYVDDQSKGGGDGGNGDYFPGADSVLRGKITSSRFILPRDLLGYPRGATDSAGAYTTYLGLTYSSGDGTDTLTFIPSRPVRSDETITLDYTPGDVEDAAGNALEAITDEAVTNNSTV